MTESQGVTAQKRALMIFAHADDETLLAGALIAKLVADGWRVHLLCAAPGDDEDRYARMELAAAELGIESVSSLRFSGSGGDAPAIDNPRKSPPLLAAPEDAIVSQVEGKIAELAPAMIVTHSPTGDYGHPDHALCHQLTVKAAASAAPQAAVYALAWPKKMLWLNSLAERTIRAVTLRWMRGGDADRDAPANADRPHPARLPVTTTHDVHRFLPARKKAARHYRKELSNGPLPLRLLEVAPVFMQQPVLGKAHLSRVR